MNNANAPAGHLQTLISYQAWRRHESDTAEPAVMPHPKAISEALDWAIEMLTELSDTVKQLTKPDTAMGDWINIQVRDVMKKYEEHAQ